MNPSIGKNPRYEVREHRLANGLRALLLESREKPIVCLSVWYRAGSRDDPAGKSGLAHLLEHMMFKGTARCPRGEYDRILHRQGASTNASTWYDRTNYYALISSDRVRIALELEADRMRNACLTAEDLAVERTVVRNELDRGEDDPTVALFDRLHAVAFLQHPYRRPVIGWREDVETIDEEDLRAFYDRYYRPDNAFVVAVGDFDGAEMRPALEETFGAIVPLGVARSPRVPEPPQRGERRIELRKAGHNPYLAMAYKTVARNHPDSFALDVLAQVLGHGRTARLYQRLVAGGLAVGVDAENQTMPVDPFLFYIEAEPARDVAMEKLEAAIEEELDRLAQAPIAADELARARKRARVDFVMRQNSVSALTFLIGECEVTTGWPFVNTYLDEIYAVTPDRIMNVVRTYFVRDERTVAHFRPLANSALVPEADGDGDEGDAA